MSIPRGLCILGAKNYARTVIGDAQQAQPAHCEQEVGHKAGGQVRGEDRGAWRTTRRSGTYRANLQASGTAIINKKTVPLDRTLCSGTMTPSGPETLCSGRWAHLCMGRLVPPGLRQASRPRAGSGIRNNGRCRRLRGPRQHPGPGERDAHHAAAQHGCGRGDSSRRCPRLERGHVGRGGDGGEA